MTYDEWAKHAEALAASASVWRSPFPMTRAEGERMLMGQGLGADEARAVVEFGIARRWLVEERVDGVTVLRPGPAALSRR